MLGELVEPTGTFKEEQLIKFVSLKILSMLLRHLGSQCLIVQGAEYELFSGPNANVTEHNAPCAVCYVPTRATTIMVPAKTSCPSSWTREYYGYLMTERHVHY